MNNKMKSKDLLKAKVFDLMISLLREVVFEAEEYPDKYDIQYFVKIMSNVIEYRLRSCINELNFFIDSEGRESTHLSKNAIKCYKKYYKKLQPLELLEEGVFKEKIIGKYVEYNRGEGGNE